MTATIANGGKLLRPHVVKEVTDLDGQVLREAEPDLLGTVDVSEADLKAVRRGMEAVVNEPHGTGWACHLDQVRVAGKTGTAQVVRMKEDADAEDSKDVAYRLRDHALFVAYAPADDPQIAVAVVVEHGSHGGSAAAPVAKAILKSYFGLTAPEPAAVAPYNGD